MPEPGRPLCMSRVYLDRSRTLLDASAPVPVDRPFTRAEAAAAGVTRRQLDAWVQVGVLRHPLRGVFHAAQLLDSLDLRLQTLRLMVPEHCVVTDRTAGWLWGANMILAPGDHLVVPRIQVFSSLPGHRLRNELAASGERTFLPGEAVLLDGLRVTSPLRTACDLGRLLHRDQALAAMDSMARLKQFSLEELLQVSERFRGYRGVRQLRHLGPWVDPGAESPGESILRLRWLDAGLPRPVCQVPIVSPYGTTWKIDMGLPDRRFGAEYDGDAFHGPDQADHDARRHAWLADGLGWHVVTARSANVHGRTQDIAVTLVSAARRCGVLP